MTGQPSGLQMDVQQLLMAGGYFVAGKHSERAVFELTVRRMPANRDYLIAAGRAQVVEYLTQLRFTDEDVAYLRRVPALAPLPAEFWEYLRNFRFRGTVFGLEEGTPFFPGEPVLMVQASLIEAQIPESFLLAAISYQTMIASKAARLVEAAGWRPVIELGSARTSPCGAAVASRAAYIGGVAATSNIEAGARFGIPVFGSASHSWNQAFASEERAFRAFQQLLNDQVIHLVDTYDAVQGTRTAAKLGRPIWGVRIDNGDVENVARSVRQILDHAELRDAKIMVSGELNESKIRGLVGSGAPIDVFGVGTDLIVSSDAPALPADYRLAELDLSGIKRYTAKYSIERLIMPGAKQVFRYAGRDVIGCSMECSPDPRATEKPEALLKPLILEGHPLEPIPTAEQAREHAAASRAAFDPLQHKMFYSPELIRLARQQGAIFKIDYGKIEHGKLDRGPASG